MSCRSILCICHSDDDLVQVGVKLGERGIYSLSSGNPNGWDVHRGLF